MSGRARIINIVDATNIERNLYLTMQLMELDIPMVLALNMMDEVEGQRRLHPYQRHGSRSLRMPVVPISAAKNRGRGRARIDHAVHVARYQERPGLQDFCEEQMTMEARCTARFTVSCI